CDGRALRLILVEGGSAEWRGVYPCREQPRRGRRSASMWAVDHFIARCTRSGQASPARRRSSTRAGRATGHHCCTGKIGQLRRVAEGGGELPEHPFLRVHRCHRVLVATARLVKEAPSHHP